MQQPTGYHLAEFNMAKLIAPKGDPRIKDFADAVDMVNALAERMPGFQWRLDGELQFLIDPTGLLLPNMSVWKDVQALENFAWNTLHRKFYERRAEWFEIMDSMHFVMWWVPEGHQPTMDEAMDRLTHLQENGDSDHAFGWTYLKDAVLWKQHRAMAAE